MLDFRTPRGHRSWLSSPRRFHREGNIRAEGQVRVKVCFHDICFDGASSAAVLSPINLERIHSDADFCITAMTHKASQPFQDDMFDGDENDIVDFQYSNA